MLSFCILGSVRISPLEYTIFLTCGIYFEDALWVEEYNKKCLYLKLYSALKHE